MGAEPCRLTICLWGWKTVQSVQGPVLSEILFYTSCHTSGDSLGLRCPCYDFKLLSLELNPSANSPNWWITPYITQSLYLNTRSHVNHGSGVNTTLSLDCVLPMCLTADSLLSFSAKSCLQAPGSEWPFPPPSPCIHPGRAPLTNGCAALYWGMSVGYIFPGKRSIYGFGAITITQHVFDEQKVMSPYGVTRKITSKPPVTRIPPSAIVGLSHRSTNSASSPSILHDLLWFQILWGWTNFHPHSVCTSWVLKDQGKLTLGLLSSQLRHRPLITLDLESPDWGSRP